MRVFGYKNTARPGFPFHPGRQIGGVADSGIIHSQIISDGAHDNQPGVEPNPHFEFNIIFLLKSPGIVAQRFLYSQ